MARVVIIGGGPGGYAAAIRAAQMGGEVLLIEQGEIGGICVNRGCIPTKALLESVRVLELIHRAAEFGVVVGEVKGDFAQMMERKEKIVQEFRSRILRLFKASKIEYLHGKAAFEEARRISVALPEGKETLEADKVIIATGAEPVRLPPFDFNHPNVLTSDRTLMLKEIPRSLLIVGGGAIGLEFATLFNTLGSQVTIVELLPHLLPTEDIRVARQIAQQFQQRGIKLYLGSKVVRLNYVGTERIDVSLDNGKEINVEKVAVCVGRVAATNGLNLAKLGIAIDERGNVVVNHRLESSLKHIYAVGDVTGKVMLAHVASAQGITAAENALGIETQIDYSAVPHCIYTHPEIASVGLNSQEVMGRKVKIGKAPFGANGRAITLGETVGSVQIIIEEGSQKILGAQIIGPQASELIHEVIVAMKNGLTAAELGSSLHAHPTLAENVQEAVNLAYHKAIYSLPSLL